jgi:hypothetical protein
MAISVATFDYQGDFIYIYMLAGGFAIVSHQPIISSTLPIVAISADSSRIPQWIMDLLKGNYDGDRLMLALLKAEIAKRMFCTFSKIKMNPNYGTSFVPDTVGTPICDLFKAAVERGSRMVRPLSAIAAKSTGRAPGRSVTRGELKQMASIQWIHDHLPKSLEIRQRARESAVNRRDVSQYSVDLAFKGWQ